MTSTSIDISNEIIEILKDDDGMMVENIHGTK